MEKKTKNEQTPPHPIVGDFLLAHGHKARGLGSTLSDVWVCHERNLEWNQCSRPFTNPSRPIHSTNAVGFGGKCNQN